MNPKPDFKENRQSRRDDNREGRVPPPLIGTVTAATVAAASETTVVMDMEAPSLSASTSRVVGDGP